MKLSLELPDSAASAAPAESSLSKVALLAFVADAASEAVLRESLRVTSVTSIEIHQGNIVRAIAALQKRPSPRVLLVDITGDDQPLDRLRELSEVVEPSVRVLVIGDRQDVNFYRQVTRSLGVTEYLYKPLTADMVERFFGPVLSDEQSEHFSGGRMLAVTGVRGGVGATTLAVNLAWYLAEHARRFTVLLDCNIQTGNAAMLLGLKPGGGLRTALESPARVDGMFLERAVTAAGARLNLLGGESELNELPLIAQDGASHLLSLLRQRYNFVLADVPQAPVPLYQDMVAATDQRLLVMDSSLACVRETLRHLAMPNGARQKRRPTIVLNGADKPGGLTQKQVEEALEVKVDAALPYLAQAAGAAATMGKPLVETSAKFRVSIGSLLETVLSVSSATISTKPSVRLPWLRTKSS